MLILREKQLDAFTIGAEIVFWKAVALQMRSQNGSVAVKLPDGNKTVSDLAPEVHDALVHAAFTIARTYGLKLQSSLNKFILLMFAAGPKFHHQSGIHDVLADSSLPPDRRMAILFRRTTDEDWLEAQKSYSNLSWVEVVPALSNE